MPGLDGTGPKGRGPMTGGGEGFCIVVLGNNEQEIAELKNRAGSIRKQLKNIKNRIKELQKPVSTT
jgi:hypothetical protein